MAKVMIGKYFFGLEEPLPSRFDLMGRLVSAYQLIQVIADLSFGNHAITSAWNNIWSLLP